MRHEDAVQSYLAKVESWRGWSPPAQEPKLHHLSAGDAWWQQHILFGLIEEHGAVMLNDFECAECTLYRSLPSGDLYLLARLHSRFKSFPSRTYFGPVTWETLPWYAWRAFGRSEDV